jgi:formate dehydrogenase major subunit
MGAIPHKLTGFQDVPTNMEARARLEAVYGTPIPPKPGWHLSLIFEARERGELTACYIIGENPLRSEADTGRTRKLLGGLAHLVVQDIFLTDTAGLADVVKRVASAVGEGAVSIPLVHRWLDTTAEAKGRSWGRHQARSGQ